MADNKKFADISPFLPGQDGPDLEKILGLASSAGSQHKFLATLHGSYPGFFENHVLLHNTGSLQAASKMKPRVVLFGWGLLMAFEAPEHGRVEIISFNPNKSRSEPEDVFDFAEIEFGSRDQEREIEEAPGRPVIHRDPPACAACHGLPGKPLWEAYDFWPDAYGSAIGRFKSREELHAYEKYSAGVERAGIYHWLRDERIVQGSEIQLPGIEAFTLYVQSLNMLRVARSLQRHDATLAPFASLVDMILSREFDRDDGSQLISGLPAGLVDGAGNPYATFLKETRETRARWKGFLEDRYKNNFRDAGGALPKGLYAINHDRLGREAVVIAQLRFVLENAGIPTAGWSTSPGMNPWFMSTPNNFAALDLKAALFFAGPDFIRNRDLDADRDRVFRNLATVRFPPSTQATANNGAVGPASIAHFTPLARCAACHAEAPSKALDLKDDIFATGAPRIPFDDFQEFRTFLKARPGMYRQVVDRVLDRGARRMPPPPHAPLSDGERTALLDLFTRAKP